MSNDFHSRMRSALKLDYGSKTDLWLTEQITLRKLVGILGVLLPLLLWMTLFLDSGYLNTMESISHYYYTRASGVFVIVVSLLAIFLLIYKGHDIGDFYLSGAAGLFALCVVLFPTSNISDEHCLAAGGCAVTVLKESGFRVGFHYSSAAIFLACLAGMSIWFFTKSDKNPSERGERKKLRNKIYLFCGWLMVTALLVILNRFIEDKTHVDFIISREVYDRSHLTFWMETVAVEAFGVSWLIKGEITLKDNPHQQA